MSTLTNKERQILQLKKEGKTIAEISRALGMYYSTVYRTHNSAIVKELRNQSIFSALPSRTHRILDIHGVKTLGELKVFLDRNKEGGTNYSPRGWGVKSHEIALDFYRKQAKTKD